MAKDKHSNGDISIANWIKIACLVLTILTGVILYVTSIDARAGENKNSIDSVKETQKLEIKRIDEKLYDIKMEQREQRKDTAKVNDKLDRVIEHWKIPGKK